MTIATGEYASLVKGSSYNLTSPGVVAAFNDLRQLAEYAAPGLITEQSREIYDTGKAAFLIDGTYELPGITLAGTSSVKKNTEMLELPTAQQTSYVSSSLSIPSSISSSDKTLAWEFIEQTIKPASEKLFAKDVEAPAPLLSVDSTASIPFRPVQIAVQGGANAVPSNVKFLQNYGEISNDFESAISSLFSSSASTVSVLKSLESQLPSLK
jgi:ABC-type glycerol-3-phosphate transport system substrate-binding protein